LGRCLDWRRRPLRRNHIRLDRLVGALGLERKFRMHEPHQSFIIVPVGPTQKSLISARSDGGECCPGRGISGIGLFASIHGMSANFGNIDCSYDAVQPLFNEGGQARTKRQMVPRSCTICRSLKKKCDEQRPCSRCRGKGEPDKCVDWEPQHKMARKESSEMGDGHTVGNSREREEAYAALQTERMLMDRSQMKGLFPMLPNSWEALGPLGKRAGNNSRLDGISDAGVRSLLEGQNHRGGCEIPDLGIAAAAAVLGRHLEKSGSGGMGYLNSAVGSCGGMHRRAGSSGATMPEFTPLLFPPPLLPVQVDHTMRLRLIGTGAICQSEKIAFVQGHSSTNIEHIPHQSHKKILSFLSFLSGAQPLLAEIASDIGGWQRTKQER
jgi:hypothetical protein